MSDKSLRVMVDRIWLQGEEVLVPMLPTEGNVVRYRVPGLDDSLEIRDWRAKGLLALEAARTKAGAQNFHENFDSPALVTIHTDEGSTVIELSEPADSNVKVYDVLWVATLVKESLPAWPMPWHFQSSPQGERRSFVAILE